MARRIKVDSEKLVKMVQDGTVEKAVLEKFGLNDTIQRQTAAANALNQMKRSPKSRSTACRSPKVVREVRVSKRGSIAIPRKFVEALGFHTGDAFQVSPSKAGLSLKKVRAD